ncbi:regulatory protein RecX [Bacteroidota bacterium]
MKKEKALSITRKMCSKGEKCCSDIRKKLDSFELSEEDQKIIISSLIKDKFIDEKRYSKFFASDKFKFNKWGKIKISYMLKEKGIKEEDINFAIKKIDVEEYRQTLNNILKNKLKSIKVEGPYEQKARLMRFGQSRGFEAKLIYEISDELLTNK